MELKVGMKVKSNDDENDIFIIEKIENRHVFCKLDNPYEYVTIKMDIDHFKTFFTEVKEKTDPIVESVITTPSHYDNSKGTLYKVALERGWNAYLFDIVKRLERAEKKGVFDEDLDKSIAVIQLWKKERNENYNKENN